MRFLIDGGRTRAFGARWPELRALIAWWFHSWLRPPDAEAGWQQRP